MGLETVVEDIREEARAEAQEIRNDADERAQEIIESARADADSIREDARATAGRRIDQERERALSSANLEAKQDLLRARRNLLEQVRSGVEHRLADADGERRRELTEPLLDAAATEFKDDEHIEVYCRAADADLVDDLVADRDGFTRAGEIDCLGGVIVEGADGNIRINNTFDSVIDAVWEDRLKDISDRLFQE